MWTYWDVYLDGQFHKRVHYMGFIGKVIKDIEDKGTVTVERKTKCFG